MATLQKGKKGGTYYISKKGKKVYASKVPAEEKEKAPPKAKKEKKSFGEGEVHPTHAKKVAGFKKKGQASGDTFEGQEVFVGGKGNHFYVHPQTGNKVIFTKAKSKSLGLGSGGGSKKAAPTPGSSVNKPLSKAKAAPAPAPAPPKSSGSKAHPKEKKYAGLETGNTNADGQTVFKGKGGNYFTVHPDKGNKIIMTKASAKAQGISGGGSSKKAKSEPLTTKSAYNKANKNFKPLGYSANKIEIGHASDKQWNEMGHSSQTAIQHYTGSGYKQMNGGLRKPPPDPSTAGRVQAMDKAFKKDVSTPHDYQVFRGTSSNDASRIPEVGGTYNDSGYSSTSFDKNSANAFQSYKKHKMLMTIDVPKGSKAIYVDKKSKNKGEKELLLDRGAKVRIVSKTMVNGVWHVKGRLETTHNS